MSIYGISDFTDKKVYLLFLLTVLLLACTSCENVYVPQDDINILESTQTVDLTDTIESSTEELINEISGVGENDVGTSNKYSTVLIDEKYYRLYLSNTFEYSYEVLDKEGNVFDEHSTYFIEPSFSTLTDGIIKITVQTGTGRVTSQTQYYDAEKALLSDVYDYVLCEKNTLVAAGNLDINGVVIYDMFDKNKVVFSIPLEDIYVSFDDPIEDAWFSEDADEISIKYKISPDGKTKTIIVGIN